MKRLSIPPETPCAVQQWEGASGWQAATKKARCSTVLQIAIGLPTSHASLTCLAQAAQAKQAAGSFPPAMHPLHKPSNVLQAISLCTAGGTRASQ
jgi:hypothetical protein